VITWTAAQYEKFSAPLLILILLVTAVCPLADVKKNKNRLALMITIAVVLLLPAYFLSSQSEKRIASIIGFWSALMVIFSWFELFVRSLWQGARQQNQPSISNRIRLPLIGTMLLHIGIGLSAFGITGQETLSKTFDVEIAQNEEILIGGIKISLVDSKSSIDDSGKQLLVANLELIENGKDTFHLMPDQEYFPKMSMLYARPAINSNYLRDVQIIINRWQNPDNGKMSLHVVVNPYLAWLWIGGIFMCLGGLIAIFKPIQKKEI
jgi:cytochrome c-type biogenesis protein CcmF